MRIVIDLTSLSYHMSGIERYALCVSEKMLSEDKTNKYILVFRNEIYPSLKKYIDNSRVSALILHGNSKVVFLQVILPLHLYRIKADKYVFFAFTSPVLFRKKGIYNTIHDMGAWDCSAAMTFVQKVYWKISYRIAAGVSEQIITVSEFSKSRIQKILKYPRNKIQVVYSAVPESLFKECKIPFEIVKSKYKLPDKYIMTLSTLEPRKNMELLLKVFSEIQDEVDYNLVLVGRKGWKIEKLLDTYKLDKRICITGFVQDEHVALIYKNALCFVFPSLYEGFGLPPVEALSIGTPVISSDAASMPEVLRNQAIFFENNNLNELKALLLNLENEVSKMPCELDEYQKKNYRFDVAAEKMVSILRGIKK